MHRIRTFAATAIGLAAIGGTLHAQAWEQWSIEPSSGTSTQRSGFSMVLAGDTLVVGAPYEDTLASSAGSVFVWRWDAAAAAWQLEQQLFPSDPEANANFGHSVAIEGDLIVVGAPLRTTAFGNDGGQAYVFRYDAIAATWDEEQILLPSSGTASDKFGNSVGVSGTLAIVGVPSSDTSLGSHSGSAFVYRYKNPTLKWVEETQLLDPDGKASDAAGIDVALQGSTAIVASNKSDEGGKPDSGSVAVWSVSGTTWTQVQELALATPQSLAEFGTRVKLEGDLLFATAPIEDDGGFSNSGAAYVFRLVSGTYVLETRFGAPVPATSLQFGSDVAMSDDLVVVGAQAQDVAGRSDAGAAHLFRRTKKGAWVYDQQLGASDSKASDRLGGRVAIHDAMILAAADGNDTASGTDFGSIYAYSPVEIALSIEPASPVPDETIVFEAFRGPVGELVMVTIEDVSGIPLFLPLIVTTFSSNHAFTFTADAPNPAYGLHVGMRAWKISPTGPVVFSELAYVDV